MEASGSDGLRGRWSWSYLGLGQSGWSPYRYSIGSSSSSGTISTAYSSACTGSRPSTSALFFFNGHDHYHQELTEEKKLQIKSLVQEFFGNIDSSWDLKRWFTELGVGWVFYVPDGASAGMSELKSWISSLHEIGETIRLMASLFPEMSSSRTTPDSLQFARFIKEIIFRMLPFVDAIVALNATAIIIQEDLVKNLALLGPYERLTTLLGVHGALSSASAKIQSSFHSDPSELAKMIPSDVAHDLSRAEHQLVKAIRSTMEHTRTCALHSVGREDGDGYSSSTGYSQGHSICDEIHQLTAVSLLISE